MNLADAANGHYAFYRYHVPDPIYFNQDIRVTFQQIGGAYARDIYKIRDSGLPLTGIDPADDRWI